MYREWGYDDKITIHILDKIGEEKTKKHKNSSVKYPRITTRDKYFPKRKKKKLYGFGILSMMARTSNPSRKFEMCSW